VHPQVRANTKEIKARKGRIREKGNALEFTETALYDGHGSVLVTLCDYEPVARYGGAEIIDSSDFLVVAYVLEPQARRDGWSLAQEAGWRDQVREYRAIIQRENSGHLIICWDPARDNTTWENPAK
jgi:hypothetical protein